MIERDEAPLFPPNPAPYLTGWLFDVGPTCPSSMGEAVVSYQDLAAWQAISGVELMPWEARTLKRLSRSYLAMSQRAGEPDCAPPYSGTVDDLAANREQVDRQIRAAFSQLRKG